MLTEASQAGPYTAHWIGLFQLKMSLRVKTTSPWVIAAACAVFGFGGCGKKDSAGPAAGQGSSGGPGPAVVSAVKPVLETGTTRERVETGAMEPACSLEAIVQLPNEKRFEAASAVYTVPRDITVKLIGFGTNKSKGSDLGPFTALLASTAAVYKVAGQTQLERPDVVSFFKAPGMLKSGFQIDVDLKDIPPGDYAVLLQPASGSSCPTHHTIRVQ